MGKTPKLESVGAPPLSDGGVADPWKQGPFRCILGYHEVFGFSASKGVGITRGTTKIGE